MRQLNIRVSDTAYKQFRELAQKRESFRVTMELLIQAAYKQQFGQEWQQMTVKKGVCPICGQTTKYIHDQDDASTDEEKEVVEAAREHLDDDQASCCAFDYCPECLVFDYGYYD